MVLIMGFSKYPNKIDGSLELPPAIDNVTPVAAEVVNRLRDAILAVESELGIDPSREFGTVRARLDALRVTALESSGLGSGGVPTADDKNLNPNATSGNNEATGITITASPFNEGYVTVILNGLSVQVGNGIRNRDCYFSSNGGVTAKSFSNLNAGDELFWNGVNSGLDLDVNDIIDLDYDINSGT